MHVSKQLNLNPRQVARPLHDIRDWRLPDSEDLLVLHRGVLKMLDAMEALRRLEVPIAVAAEDSVPARSGFDDRETLFTLLGDAEEALDGYPHRLRIQRVAQQSPGHAAQLEQARCDALSKMRSLRTRMDFLRAGLDGLDEPDWIRERAEAQRVLQ